MRALAIATAAAVTAVTPNLPPVKGWPPYPRFPASSCWARVTDPAQVGTVGGAPSFVTRTARRSPQSLADSVLAQLGDRRFVTRVQIGPVPQLAREHNGYFSHGTPPRDALWAWLAVRRTPAKGPVRSIADWEAQLVWGALRDAFCANGGAPLVGWSAGGHPGAVSDAMNPFGQRFPSPTRAAFATRAAAVGRAFGFRVVSIRRLRPLQAAPIVVVRTDRNRTSFVGDVAKIVQLLDPRQSSGNRTAVTFEGFYFEARDARGAFVSAFQAYRGTVEGGQWSWNPCVYPYPHGSPISLRC